MPSSSKKISKAPGALDEFEFELATADLVGDLLDEIHRVLEVEAQRLGMTKAALAERMGRDKSEVTKLLSGHRNLTFQTAARIIRALDHQAEIALKPLYTPHGDNRPTYHEVHELVQRQPYSASVTAADKTASISASRNQVRESVPTDM